MKLTLFVLVVVLMGSAQAQTQSIDHAKISAIQQAKINHLTSLLEAQANEIQFLKKQMVLTTAQRKTISEHNEELLKIKLALINAGINL